MTWQDPILLADAEVHVRGIGRFHVRAHSDDLWHVLPSREAAIFATLRAKLRQGDVFIDAGANIGIYTVLASRLVGPTGRVISVEMMPDTGDQLERHIVLNALRNVDVVRAALSESGGTTVTARVEAGKYGQARIAKNESEANVSAGVTRIEVPALTFGDLPVPPDRRVRLIKIDLEGAEVAALRGAGTVLDRTDFVVFESWSSVKPPGGPVADYLASRGFECTRLDGNNWLASRRSAAQAT